MTVSDPDAVIPQGLDPSLSLEAFLNSASTGEMLELGIALLNQTKRQLRDPQAYENLPEYGRHRGQDWSGLSGEKPAEEAQEKLAIMPEADAPQPPENIKDALPELNTMMRSAESVVTQLRTILANFTERAFKSDKVKKLGIPAEVRGWRKVAGYMAETQNEAPRRVREFLNRSEYITDKDSRSVVGKRSTQLQVLSEAYFSNEIGQENLDRSVKLVKQLVKYVHDSGSEARLADLWTVIHAFEPTIAEAAAILTPAEFHEECIKWLDEIAHRINPDGPSPSEIANKRKEFFRYSVDENGFLTVSFGTYDVKRETFESIIRPGMSHTKNMVTSEKFSELFDSKEGADKVDAKDPPEDAESTELDSRPRGSDSFLDIEKTADGFDPDQVIGIDEDGNETKARDVHQIDPRSPEEKALDNLVTALMALFRMTEKDTVLPKLNGTVSKLFLIRDARTSPSTDDEQSLFEHPNLKLPPASRPYFPVTEDGVERVQRVRSEGLYSGRIPADKLDPLNCDAEITNVYADGDNILQFGRKERTFTPAQRDALMIRDGGCIYPGCQVMGAWCHVHHVIPYSEGGITDTSNAVLVCSAHHTDIHQGKIKLKMINGVPYAKLAEWILPWDTYRRNAIWMP